MNFTSSHQKSPHATASAQKNGCLNLVTGVQCAGLLLARTVTGRVRINPVHNLQTFEEEGRASHSL